MVFFYKFQYFSRFVKGIFFFSPRFISEKEKAQRRKWQRNHRPPPPPPLFPCTQIPQKEGPLREEILIRRPSLPPFPNRPLIEESSRHFFGKRGEGGRRKKSFHLGYWLSSSSSSFSPTPSKKPRMSNLPFLQFQPKMKGTEEESFFIYPRFCSF